MSILVKDILKLKSLEEMKLVGGSIGLEKCIEWVYVSECLEDPLEGIKWLQGGEIVIITGVGIKSDINVLTKLIEGISEKNGAALIVNVGKYIREIPEEAIKIAEKANKVRKEPLRRAQLHIDEYGLSDKITTQLCDGLKGINKGDVDTVTICGMGGKLMKSILQAGIDKLGYNTQLVLSAQSELRDFRAYLLEAGIDIKSEHILLEDGKYYFIFDCVYNTPYEQHFNKNVVDADDIYKNDNQNNNEKNNDK